ncbi:hypothetical protein CHS0354_019111, partial [Potamilus streckersoni]
ALKRPTREAAKKPSTFAYRYYTINRYDTQTQAKLGRLKYRLDISALKEFLNRNQQEVKLNRIFNQCIQYGLE